jgi:hypothetical protein
VTDENYTKRHSELETAAIVTVGDEGWVSVQCQSSSGFSFKPEVEQPQLEAGDQFVLELRGGSQVTGVRLRGVWLMHKSDEQLQREHDAFVEKRMIDQRARWVKHRDEWQRREDALPEWVKPRFATFHEHGGEEFEIDGWEYELVVGELAAIYRESGGEDNASIMEYANLHGTSGNQHDFAKALAKTEDASVAETIAALTPLGAHPFYEAKESA